MTIRGWGLKGANAVKFGTTDATDLKFGTIDGAGFTASAGGPYLQVKVPAHSVTSAGTDVDVTVLFPVASPTNSFVVGKYHYD